MSIIKRTHVTEDEYKDHIVVRIYQFAAAFASVAVSWGVIVHGESLWKMILLSMFPLGAVVLWLLHSLSETSSSSHESLITYPFHLFLTLVAIVCGVMEQVQGIFWLAIIPGAWTILMITCILMARLEKTGNTDTTYKKWSAIAKGEHREV